MGAIAQSNRLLQQLTDLMADPNFDAVMRDIGARLFEPAGNRLRLIQGLDRFVAKSTRFTPTSAVIRQVPIKICERDPNRIALWVFNNGPNTIFLGTSAVKDGAALGDPNAGWPLPNQASASIGSVAGEIWATSTLGNNDLRVVDLSN